MNHLVRAEIQFLNDQIAYHEKEIRDLKAAKKQAYARCGHPNKEWVGGPLDRYQQCPDCGWEG